MSENEKADNIAASKEDQNKCLNTIFYFKTVNEYKWETQFNRYQKGVWKFSSIDIKKVFGLGFGQKLFIKKN